VDKLGKVLPTVLRRQGVQGKVAELRTRLVFMELMGKELADCCESVDLRGSTLTVTASNPAFAHQLRLDSEELISRLNSRLSGRIVRSLKVRIGHSAGPQAWGR
jgi:predicted nucleic acid-binding Zn ribbon protein